jgi:hypothetical protein
MIFQADFCVWSVLHSSLNKRFLHKFIPDGAGSELSVEEKCSRRVLRYSRIDVESGFPLKYEKLLNRVM